MIVNMSMTICDCDITKKGRLLYPNIALIYLPTQTLITHLSNYELVSRTCTIKVQLPSTISDSRESCRLIAIMIRKVQLVIPCAQGVIEMA